MFLHSDMALPEKKTSAEGTPWAVAGISPKTQLRSIRTKLAATASTAEEEEEEEEACLCATTPTATEARIPEKLPCPPAPKKRKPPLRCQLSGPKEFFSPPDLETVFLRRPERAK